MDPLAPTPDGADPNKWAAACANVRSFCGWHVAPSVTEDVTIDGSRAAVLLPSLHVTALEVVEIGGVEVDDLVVDWNKAGTMRPGPAPQWATFPWFWQKVTVRLTHGFDECPPEIVQVLDDLVSVGGIRLATRSQVGPFAHSFSPAASGGAGGVLDVYAGVLGPYRIEPAP